MQEPRPSVTSVSPAVREAASSPMRTIVSVMRRQGVPAADRRLPRPGTSRKMIEQPSSSTTMLEFSSSVESLNAARVERTACTSDASMSVAVAGGVGSISIPVMPGERVEVGRADDVADLAQRRLGVLRVRRQAEQPAERLGVRRGQQHQHDRRQVAEHAERDAGDLRLRRADRLDGLVHREQRGRPAPRRSTERPSMPERAVEALPAPMFASSRSASSWVSLYVALTRRLLGLGCSSRRSRRSRRSGRSARPRARRRRRARIRRRSRAAAGG